MGLRKMHKGTGLSRTEENYLRAIAGFEKRVGHARVRDISVELGVKSPTVTQMAQ